MELIVQIELVGAAAALAVVLIALASLAYDFILARFRRPRTVELAPGVYHFRDGEVEDGGLLWQPVEDLFR